MKTWRCSLLLIVLTGCGMNSGAQSNATAIAHSSPQVVQWHGKDSCCTDVPAGATITDVLCKLPAWNVPQPAHNNVVVLVRRGPEGLAKKNIDLDDRYELKDPAQDVSLRTGDQLVVPLAFSGPAGLVRPSVPGMPVDR